MLNSLAAAAFIILIWDPQQLFGVSFQLSFVVVLSIALFLDPLQRLFDGLIQTDPLLPAMLVPRWRQWLQIPMRHVATSFAISLAAWLGSLPLCSLYFHLFSPVTLLANLFIVPLSGLALASNVGSLICGDWFSWATELFNQSAWFWMRCMTGFSEWCVSVPAGAYFYVCGFSLAGILIYYALLWIAFSRWFWAPNRWRWATLSLVLGVLFLCGEWYFKYSSVNLTILPYNGSLTVFLHSPARGSTFLSDCGTSNSVQLITKPFLRSRGVNRLPALVLTHGDLHHMGGAQLICELFPVSQVCASPVRFRSGVYRKALADFANKPGLWRKLSSSEHLGAWTVLHPRADDHFARADDNALVLHGSLKGTSVLLCSDLGWDGQQALLQRAKDLRADILISGLPSGGEPLCDGLLDAIQPRLIIIADAEFPVSERASAALHQRLGKREVPVIYTRSSGAVTIDFVSGGWRLRSVNGDERGQGT
jgi:competence protein ComEC